jgi:lysophospholipase L1-like esterase
LIRRRTIATLAIILPLLPTLRARAAEDFLPGVHRILFLGDSITQSGQYVDFIETQLLLHLPATRRFQIINCGLSSETVSGLSEEGHAGGQFPRPDLHERLDRALTKTKPDLVFACYGMNDGIYLPLSDDRFDRFKAGMLKLHEKVHAAGARVIHLTPPVFDAMPIRQRVVPADKADANHPFEGYDTVLAAYADWLLAQRKEANWQVIDIHNPMAQAIAVHRKTDPAFTFARDGIHPDDTGHGVMAISILRGLSVPFDPQARDFGDPLDADSSFNGVYKLVRQRNRILAAAWLSDIGHKRPMDPSLPMEESRRKAAEINAQIAPLLPRSNSNPKE